MWLEGSGVAPGELANLAPRLQDARLAVLGGDVAPRHATPPAEAHTLTRLLELPEQLLDDYVDHREHSQLGRILQTARRLQPVVDRVLVLGSCDWWLGARVLMDACCEPYFNELSRSQRGPRPRLYFLDNPLDNDAARGLLALLTEGRSPRRLEDRWALIAIGGADASVETAVAFRLFLDALRQFCGERDLAERVVPITGPRGWLWAACGAIGCRDRHTLQPVAEYRGFSAFSAAGLLPAAILGLDVVRLLEGASQMNDHFRTAAPGANAVLDFAGVAHLVAQKCGAAPRILQVWARSLESVGRWYDQLLAASHGTSAQAVTPVTALPADDQGGYPVRRAGMLTDVVVDQWRCDPWPVGPVPRGPSVLNGVAGSTLPELMAKATDGIVEIHRQGGQPAGRIRLPRVDEWTVGQLLQMLMLATVIEGILHASVRFDNQARSIFAIDKGERPT